MLLGNKPFSMHTIVLVIVVWKAISLFLPLVSGFLSWKILSGNIEIIVGHAIFMRYIPKFPRTPNPTELTEIYCRKGFLGLVSMY